MLQLESYCVSESSTTSPLAFEIDYIGCSLGHKDCCTDTNSLTYLHVLFTYLPYIWF